MMVKIQATFNFFLLVHAFAFSSAQDDPGTELFLTPLINAGEAVQAREAALARDFLPVISYSGFITVNETHNSNLFFWFFPSEVLEIFFKGI